MPSKSPSNSVGNCPNISSSRQPAARSCRKLAKGLKELIKVGLVEDTGCKIYSAQASGCAPIINALHKGTDLVSPVKPNTIASSIAIGDPADGYYVIQAVRESGGWGESVTR